MGTFQWKLNDGSIWVHARADKRFMESSSVLGMGLGNASSAPQRSLTHHAYMHTCTHSHSMHVYTITHTLLAGNELVIEEFLDGEEASFFAWVDGEKVVPLIAAQVRGLLSV